MNRARLHCADIEAQLHSWVCFLYKRKHIRHLFWQQQQMYQQIIVPRVYSLRYTHFYIYL